MKTSSRSVFYFLICGLTLSLASVAGAFPETHEKADLALIFTLSPTEPTSTATGMAVIPVTRRNGVETDGPIELAISGLPDGTYTLRATTKMDPAGSGILIGEIVVSANSDPLAPPSESLVLPQGLSAQEIATLSVSDATPTVVLQGGGSESIVIWRFFGNRPLLSPAEPIASGVTSATAFAKAVHGHVLIQNAIRNNVELRRKFLLVGHGLPAEITLTVNLDGMAVGTVTTTKRGKAMLKFLDGDFRLAGVHLVSLSDADGNVVAEADFFPEIE